MAQAKGVLDLLGSAPVVFGVALCVRLAYLAVVGTSAESLVHVDSELFVELAHSTDWWQGHPERMPGYPIFLHLHFLVFGDGAFWAPVASQIIVDALACVAIARTAETLSPGAGRWAGILSAVNPTQVVMSCVLLGDSLFMACLAGGFLSLALWLRDPSVRNAAGAGLWLGLAIFNRAVVWPFVPVLLVAMLATGLRSAFAWRSAVTALAVMLVFAAPIIARNWIVFGKPALSAQGGMHMALWWFPLAKEAADGTSFERTALAVAKEFVDRGGVRDGRDWFGDEALYGRIARAGLAEVGIAGIAKAWILGMSINLLSPATLMSPPVMALPRTGFYATEGASPVEKVRNFLFESSSAAYLGWLVVGIAAELPVRLLAFAGFVLALRRRETRAAGLFAALWLGYVLAVQGPVASAKYRLPVEPVCMVLAAVASARVQRAR